MSFKVGTPTLALKMTKVKQFNEKKHGLVQKILEEAGEERYSRSRTFDRSRAGLNDYSGGMFASGADAFDYVREAWAEADEVHRANSKSHRGLRKDKDVAFALIVKPPAEWANEQDAATLDRFFADFHDEMAAAGIFKDENVLIRARHRDEEGEHEHYVFMLDRTPDGDLGDGLNYWFKPRRKGDRNSSFHDMLNRDIPRAMQARGWDVEECIDADAYDSEKAAGMSEEERKAYSAECRAKKAAKRYGRSVNEYVADKRAEDAQARADAAIARAHDALSLAADAESRYNELVASAEADAQAVRAEAEAAVQAARDELADMEPTLKAGRAEIASLDADKAKAEAEKKAAEKEAADAKAEKARAFDDKLKAGRELTQTRVLVDRRKKELEELDERLATVAEREAEAARKEEQARAKLTEAARLFDAAETAQAEADAREADTLSRLVSWVGKMNPKWSRTLQGWVDGFKRAEAERKAPGRERVREGRRAVNTALLGRERGEENGYDY